MMQIFKVFLLIFSSTLLQAQKIDSTRYRNPNTALKKSLIPSAGQFYNGDKWKGVVFATAFLGATGSIIYNQTIYKRYQKAYLYKGSLERGTPLVENYLDYQALYDTHYATLSASTLKSNRVKFRRYRDIAVLATTGVYALSILDAYISAQL